MYVTCRDLLKLDVFKDRKLWTGDKGLDRIITWPFMTRVFLEENLFHGGEFVLVAETYIEYDENSLLSFIDLCFNRDVSGILIFIDETSKHLTKIPQSVIDRANEYALPLFELPWNIRSIDVIKKISMLIAESNLISNALESSIKNIIFFQDKISPEIIDQLNALGFNDGPYFLLRLEINNYDQYCMSKHYTTETEVQNQLNYLKNYFTSLLNSYLPDCIVCSNLKIVTALIKVKNDETEGDFVLKLENMKKQIKRDFPILKLNMCLSKKYKTIRRLKEAFHETSHIIRLCHLPENEEKVLTYNNIGIYRILFPLEPHVLKETYDYTMFELIKHDEQFFSNFLDTLLAYLENDCNLEETANVLFIHKNTLRYRLKKIEEITGEDFKSTEALSVYYYAHSIKKYLSTFDD